MPTRRPSATRKLSAAAGSRAASLPARPPALSLHFACWTALLKAPRAVLAGDHLQLPPTVLSKEAERGGLGLSLFQRLQRLHGGAVPTKSTNKIARPPDAPRERVDQRLAVEYMGTNFMVTVGGVLVATAGE